MEFLCCGGGCPYPFIGVGVGEFDGLRLPDIGVAGLLIRLSCARGTGAGILGSSFSSLSGLPLPA